MLGIDRHAARNTFTAVLVLLAFYLVYMIRSTLFVFILAILFAYLLSPLVNLLDRALPTRTRTPELALS
jgi:predicted PurR-regulated permease PerM